MNRILVEELAEQTEVVLRNVGTCLRTCLPEQTLCDQPIWKHVYHMLHSLDQWFINPSDYQQPPFHQPGLNSLDEPAGDALDMALLTTYFEGIEAKIRRYLAELNDDDLAQCPPGFHRTRLSVMVGQIRHCICHVGNINAVTIAATGRWPRATGLAPLPEGEDPDWE